MSLKRFFVIECQYYMYIKVRLCRRTKNRQKTQNIKPYKQKIPRALFTSECLSIDESTIPFKGNVTFKVYNPNKPAKHGIKVYMCSDSKTGYIYKLKICSERSTLVKTVTDLLTGLENKWHKIFMNNFYNSFNYVKNY
ncbi:PiggyBac transposable element-derived protein 4 [Cucumispora dikerogammari]|nr:PiggyBac transposable element-derived protein 4 [Cucumispora dikerogammari]